MFSTNVPITILQQQTGGAGALVLLLFFLALLVAYIAGMWKTFKKADQPGWASIVPIYNFYVMLKIGDNEWWWLLIIFFVPIVNLYGIYKMFAGVSRSFGRGVGTALGLWFLGVIFWPVLGFGDATYRGVRR